MMRLKFVVVAHDCSVAVARVEGRTRIPRGSRSLRYVYEYMAVTWIMSFDDHERVGNVWVRPCLGMRDGTFFIYIFCIYTIFIFFMKI